MVGAFRAAGFAVISGTRFITARRFWPTLRMRDLITRLVSICSPETSRPSPCHGLLDVSSFSWSLAGSRRIPQHADTLYRDKRSTCDHLVKDRDQTIDVRLIVDHLDHDRQVRR